MIDFVVEDKPYTMRPNFKKLTGPLCNLRPSFSYLDEKYNELKSIKQPYGLWDSSSEAYHDEIVQKTAKHLGFTANNILELGFHLEEDIVIMHKGRIQACFVAFPSGWDPASKFMMTLEEIHKPVADGNELRQASSKIAEIMASGNGPWCRTVWTISSTSKLSNHPVYTKPEPTSIDDLYFRYEYQTFDTVEVGLTSVFLIKTVVVPFKEYVDTAEKKRIIKDSINSMSHEVLTYKNLHKIKELLWQSDL
jgi:hypothetical protein